MFLAPSILACDFAILGEQLKIIQNADCKYVHIDVMDGLFVPNISFGMPVIKSIRKSTDMIFDVHLMIDKPERYVCEFAKAGADIINFHVEATENINDTIKLIKQLNKKVGLTVKPNTNIEVVYEYLQYVDLVLIMSVEPGFGGQKFMKPMLSKASKLKKYITKNNLNVLIEMDGGIDLNNAKEVLLSGVDIIVAGSSVFNNDISNAITDFNNIFRGLS